MHRMATAYLESETDTELVAVAAAEMEELNRHQ